LNNTSAIVAPTNWPFPVNFSTNTRTEASKALLRSNIKEVPVDFNLFANERITKSNLHEQESALF
jgi:hypothetical protein